MKGAKCVLCGHGRVRQQFGFLPSGKPKWAHKKCVFPHVSQKDLEFYLEGLKDDYRDSEPVWWDIHKRLREGKDLKKWARKYGIEIDERE